MGSLARLLFSTLLSAIDLFDMMDMLGLKGGSP
jgi:hypothetical protein